MCSKNIKAVLSYYEALVIYCFNGAREIAEKLCEIFPHDSNKYFLYFSFVFLFLLSLSFTRSFSASCSQWTAKTAFYFEQALYLHFIAANDVLWQTFEVVCFSDCLSTIFLFEDWERKIWEQEKFSFISRFFLSFATQMALFYENKQTVILRKSFFIRQNYCRSFRLVQGIVNFERKKKIPEYKCLFPESILFPFSQVVPNYFLSLQSKSSFIVFDIISWWLAIVNFFQENFILSFEVPRPPMWCFLSKSIMCRIGKNILYCDQKQKMLSKSNFYIFISLLFLRFEVDCNLQFRVLEEGFVGCICVSNAKLSKPFSQREKIRQTLFIIWLFLVLKTLKVFLKERKCCDQSSILFRVFFCNRREAIWVKGRSLAMIKTILVRITPNELLPMGLSINYALMCFRNFLKKLRIYALL